MKMTFHGGSTIAAFGATLVFALASARPAAAQYSAAADFDAAHDPSTKDGGVWEYGYETTLGSGFGLDTVAGTVDGLNYWTGTTADFSSVEYNGTNAPIVVGGQTWAPGTISIHDGLGGSVPNYGIVRFTAPTAGLYTVSGSFGPGDVNGSTQSFILSNGSSVYSATRTGNNSDFFNQSVSLQAGGTIDFVVGGTFNSGDTQLVASIIKSSASAPEPGALALLLPLALPIGRRIARRRRTNMRGRQTF